MVAIQTNRMIISACPISKSFMSGKRRTASIPANIAEGRRQSSEKEFARFLRYALNSASEVEYHLILAHDTQVISEEDFASLVSQTITVRKMLYGLLKRLSASGSAEPILRT